jgi:hypothetical protein
MSGSRKPEAGSRYPVERQYRHAGNLGEAEEEAATKIIDALPKGEAADQGGPLQEASRSS